MDSSRSPPQYLDAVRVGNRLQFVLNFLCDPSQFVIAVPLGIACAAYLAEVAPVRVRETIKPIIELLAGIPSVVMGFIGLMLLSPLVQSTFNLNTGLCGLTAGIMLSLMSLPIIVSVSEDALHAVPNQFKEASYALGATRWETIWHVSIPAALSGTSGN